MTLLAKPLHPDSADDLEAMTLHGHLEQGIKAALSFEAIAPLICQQLGLNLTPQDLVKNTALAIWIHDWGKGNEDFQAMVQGKSSRELLAQVNISTPVKSLRTQKHLVRHELLSVILAQSSVVRQWLKPIDERGAAQNISLLAVLGHHLKVDTPAYFDLAGDSLRVYGEKFEPILKLGCKYFGLSPTLPAIPKQFPQGNLQKCAKQLGGSPDSFFTKLDRCIDRDLDKLKKIAVVKALTMSADLAASALLTQERKGRDYSEWIAAALAQRMSVADYELIIQTRLENNLLYKFQRDAELVTARVIIVKAGGGAGKSLIPFIRYKRLAKEEKLEAKLFFCYPTIATTSQGFEDYALPTKLPNILRFHSKVQVDKLLKGFSPVYDDDDVDPVERFQTKVEVLRLWHSKLVYCTAHTVLGLLQNHRKGVYGFPAIALGAFVFDELHSYPPPLFGTLLQFLRVFRHAPIILMSASMTPQQEQAIQDVLAEQEEVAAVVEGPPEIERLERYRLHEINNESQAWSVVAEELDRNGKVLWITNTVVTAQHLYTEAKHRYPGVMVLLYHSRFRYEEAVQRHSDLMDAFDSDESVLAITTQIAEQSFDISATLLVSANAPIWALIQRLGRLNRWVEQTDDGYKLKSDRICDALIYPWENQYPYTEGIETGTQLVKALSGRAVTQADLTRQLERVYSTPPEPAECQWLKTWQATSGFLMPPSNTITALLEADYQKVKELKASEQALEAQKRAVSVLIEKDKTPLWSKWKYYKIAPTQDVHYHPEIGAYQTNNSFLVQHYGHNP